MHIYTDGVEWIIAESVEQARQIQVDNVGEEEASPLEIWSQFDDSKLLKVRSDEGTVESMTCQEWIAISRPGVLASTEA